MLETIQQHFRPNETIACLETMTAGDALPECVVSKVVAEFHVAFGKADRG